VTFGVHSSAVPVQTNTHRISGTNMFTHPNANKKVYIIAQMWNSFNGRLTVH